MYNLREILENIKDLPAMPNIVVKALKLIKDENAGVKELAGIMTYDQALSTKILNLVNSAYYGFAQQILSINQAAALLGMNGAKNVIITLAMKPMLTNQIDKSLWSHSINTAVGCEFIAQKYNLMNADEAFTIGFLHDIGKIIFNIKYAKEYAVFKKNNTHTVDIIEAEQKVFDIDHAQVGGVLAKKWKLPVALINAIKYHHEPCLSSMPNVASMTYLIDKLVSENYAPQNINFEYTDVLNIDVEEVLSFGGESL